MRSCPECPYRRFRPQTVEGWQAWHVATVAGFRLMMAGTRPLLFLDQREVAVAAETLGYDARAVLLLAPAIQAGMIAAQDGPEDTGADEFDPP